HRVPYVLMNVDKRIGSYPGPVRSRLPSCRDKGGCGQGWRPGACPRPHRVESPTTLDCPRIIGSGLVLVLVLTGVRGRDGWLTRGRPPHPGQAPGPLIHLTPPLVP